MATKKPNEFRIRPSARLIRTIGMDLIKDKYAAIVELVKNSYDADATTCEVKICLDRAINQLVISVVDNGHGMAMDTVVNKWMVPATSDKLVRKESPSGRPLQGRKGIGRFAATALGNKIELETLYENENYVTLTLDMNDFSDNKLLEDVEIDVSERKRKESDKIKKNGTSLVVTEFSSNIEALESEWGVKYREALIVELRKLLSPNEVSRASKKLGYVDKAKKFELSLVFKGFDDDQNIKIKPFNILELFDYRIFGEVGVHGDIKFSYVNNNTQNIKPETLASKVLFDGKKSRTFPGKITFDFRVFDRDPEAISQLIDRGLKDPITGKDVGKRKAKEILDSYYGVSVFRGNFRVRPYGDSDYDWLELDKKRVQNPTMKIGHNQIIGFVNIQSEELSSLEEKSARDGLLENSSYFGLKYSLMKVLNELESRRYLYRNTLKRSRGKKTIEDLVGDVFDFDSVAESLEAKISALNLNEIKTNKIIKIVEKELGEKRDKSSKELKEIQETIALYQGQATLGKITHVFLHEGRKHIKAINEIPPRLTKWVGKIVKNYDEDIHEKIIDRSNLLVSSSKAFSHLFKRIEPLSATRRPTRKEIGLKQELESCFSIFEAEFDKAKVTINFNVDSDIQVYGSSFDLTTIFANLIENSLYWISVGIEDRKDIQVEAEVGDNYVEISYRDSGPGFQGANLELMFDPGFSMKPDGTGLGLALAGESVLRIGGEIRAIKSVSGAEFLIRLKSNK
jgi:signal transduction histidine kinase